MKPPAYTPNRLFIGPGEASLILLGCFPRAAYYLFLATTGTTWAVVAGQLPNALFISVAVGLGTTECNRSSRIEP